jgi:hypothetical protein
MQKARMLEGATLLVPDVQIHRRIADEDPFVTLLQ